MPLLVKALEQRSPGRRVPVRPCRGYRQTKDDELHVTFRSGCSPSAVQESGRVQALRLRAPRDLAIIDALEPAPGPGDVVIRVRACGVCGSDLNAWRGVPGIEYPLE